MPPRLTLFIGLTAGFAAHAAEPLPSEPFCRELLAKLEAKYPQEKELVALPGGARNVTRFHAYFVEECLKTPTARLSCPSSESFCDGPMLVHARAFDRASEPEPIDPALAAKKAPAERCEAIVGYLRPMMDRELRGMPPRRLAALWRHVAEGCARFPPQVLTCIEGDVSHSLEKCPELQPMLKAAFQSPDVVTSDELAAMRLQGAQSEARTGLSSLGVVARSLYDDSSRPQAFTFPASAKATPAGDCCTQPGGKCRWEAKDWSTPTWKALGPAQNWDAADGVRYHYSFSSKGRGLKATFVARAEGDPLCSGKKEVWQIEGHVEGDRVVVSAPTLVP